MREHDGDSLYLIALDQALAPSTLRQRICRLRKSLRARYLAPLIVAVGLGSAWAMHRTDTGQTAASMSQVLSPYAGTWRVTRASSAEYAALQLRVSIDGNQVRVFRSEPHGRAHVAGRALSLK